MAQCLRCELNETHEERKWSVKPWSQDWLIAAGAYPGFCSMKRLEVFLLPLDGMLVRRRSLLHNLFGFPNNLTVPIYTPGWREALWELSVLPKNTTQCPRPGHEPGPLAPESSALTMRPPRLPQYFLQFSFKVSFARTVFSKAFVFPGNCEDDSINSDEKTICWVEQLRHQY